MLIGSPPFLLSRRKEINESDRLTISERRFFYAYLRMGEQKAAFLLAFPHKKLKNPDSAATKLMRRLKEKHDWDQLLSDAGLGYERIFPKLEEMLEAKTEKFYQDRSLGEFTDNATRMRALELLTDLHGRRKQTLEVKGTITLADAIQKNYENRKALYLVGDDEHSDSKQG